MILAFQQLKPCIYCSKNLETTFRELDLALRVTYLFTVYLIYLHFNDLSDLLERNKTLSGQHSIFAFVATNPSNRRQERPAAKK